MCAENVPRCVPVVRLCVAAYGGRRAFLFAFRGVLLASSAGRLNPSRLLRCWSPLAKSVCLCPLAPDWRTAIARPKGRPPLNRFFIQPSSSRREAPLVRSLCRRWPSCLGTGGNSERTETFQKFSSRKSGGIRIEPPPIPPPPRHGAGTVWPNKKRFLTISCAVCLSAIRLSWRS